MHIIICQYYSSESDCGLHQYPGPTCQGLLGLVDDFVGVPGGNLGWDSVIFA